MILKDLVKFELSDSPGVYVFLDVEIGVGKELIEGGGGFAAPPKNNIDLTIQKDFLNNYKDNILYIGKATSLKSRVKSYFDNDILHKRGLHIGNMITLSKSIYFIENRSVLEALLLETELIKKYKPKYNTISKDDKSFFVLIITDENFPRVTLARLKDIDKKNNLLIKSKFISIDNPVKIKNIFGPYPSGQYAKESLKLIRKIFPFRDKCEVYDKRKAWDKKPCFSYQIGLCPGTCNGVCNKSKYHKIIERLTTFLEGNGEKVRRDLEDDMNNYSKKLQFEEAQKVKETLFALDHIRDAHLISKDINEEDKNVRIEAYDIAHLSGTNRVGVMTVIKGGILAKHEYKKFKISLDKNDDLEGLEELLKRRFTHTDWGTPDYIIVDGDERHLNLAEKIADQARINNNIFNNLKVFAITKDRSHKANKIIGNSNNINNLEIINKFKNDFVLANSEAHRFSLAFHKNLRKKAFLG